MSVCGWSLCFRPVCQTAEGAIGTGAADLIAFGRLYLSNPDLVPRLENGWCVLRLRGCVAS